MRNLLIIVSFILVSFGVGISLGFSKGGTPQAFAKNYPTVQEQINVYPAIELNLTSVGSGGELNDKVSQLFSFTSSSSVDDLVSSQEKRWQEVGLSTSGKVSPQRAVLLGINKESKELFQLVAFFCPPAVREKLCSGEHSFGMISRMSQEVGSKGSRLPFKICSGAKEISSYAASDLGHPSITATYLCPSSTEAVESELDSEFIMWHKKESSSDVLVYSKEDEEVTILPSGKDGKSLLVVTYQRGV